MGSFSVTVKNEWVSDFISTTKYIALFDGDPSSSGSEIVGGGYSRKQVTGLNWNVPLNGVVTNKVDLSFPSATDNWNNSENITHFALMSASTGGVVLAHDDLSTAKPVFKEDIVSFGAGSITLSIS